MEILQPETSNLKLFYFQVRESPAPLNIPTPTPAPRPLRSNNSENTAKISHELTDSFHYISDKCYQGKCLIANTQNI